MKLELDPYTWDKYPDIVELNRCSECLKEYPDDEFYRFPSTGDYICWTCLCDEAEKEGLTVKDYIKTYEIIIL